MNTYVVVTECPHCKFKNILKITLENLDVISETDPSCGFCNEKYIAKAGMYWGEYNQLQKKSGYPRLCIQISAPLSMIPFDLNLSNKKYNVETAVGKDLDRIASLYALTST